MDVKLKQTLNRVASFYDRRKVGEAGALGFRRSTDLMTLAACIERLTEENIVTPGMSKFLDLGCADGRVNVLLSYLTALSAGIEIDGWTLEEYEPLRSDLEKNLRSRGLPLPPDNIFLLHGDAMAPSTHFRLARETGVGLGDFDLFYTCLVMYEEFAGLLSRLARPGASLLIYGLGSIVPRIKGFALIEELSPLEGTLAVYRKTKFSS
jgi:hypothetical protein